MPNVDDLSIRVSSSKKNGGTIHKVKRSIEHKGFSEQTVDYDFSLLELEEEIESNDNQTDCIDWQRPKRQRQHDVFGDGMGINAVNWLECSAPRS